MFLRSSGVKSEGGYTDSMAIFSPFIQKEKMHYVLVVYKLDFCCWVLVICQFCPDLRRLEFTKED